MEKYETLIIDEGEYKTHLTKKFVNRTRWTKPDPRRVVSYIPGTILKISVKEGQAVKTGDNLLVLEAMKMRNKITAPVDGTIKKINVQKNETVAKGVLLVEIK